MGEQNFERAVRVLEPLELTPETEAQWMELSELALQNNQVGGCCYWVEWWVYGDNCHSVEEVPSIAGTAPLFILCPGNSASSRFVW